MILVYCVNFTLRGAIKDELSQSMMARRATKAFMTAPGGELWLLSTCLLHLCVPSKPLDHIARIFNSTVGARFYVKRAQRHNKHRKCRSFLPEVLTNNRKFKAKQQRISVLSKWMSSKYCIKTTK